MNRAHAGTVACKHMQINVQIAIAANGYLSTAETVKDMYPCIQRHGHCVIPLTVLVNSLSCGTSQRPGAPILTRIMP